MCAKTLIIIPAFNEEASIASSIEALESALSANASASKQGARPDTLACEFDFVVIDDGSSDNTAAICAQRGFPCVSLCTNLGLTGAFRTGMKIAARGDYSYVLQYDADGQHDPRFIEPMICAAEDGGFDIVIGSRFVDAGKSLTPRMIGSTLISVIIKLTSGQHLSDPTSGMRLYGARAIHAFAEGFDISPEPDTLALLMRKGMRVTEVPVEMHERTAGKSYLTITKSISYMLRICMAILFANWYRSCP